MYISPPGLMYISPPPVTVTLTTGEIQFAPLTALASTFLKAFFCQLFAAVLVVLVVVERLVVLASSAMIASGATSALVRRLSLISVTLHPSVSPSAINAGSCWDLALDRYTHRLSLIICCIN